MLNALLLALVLPLRAAVLPAYTYEETSDMHEVFDSVERLSAGGAQVLLVFDIDNTLLMLDQQLGSEQWFETEAAALAAKRLPGALAAKRFDQLIELNGALMGASGAQLTQNDIPARLAALPAGVKVVSITSRSQSLAPATLRSFHANGLNFSAAFGPGPLRFSIGGASDVECHEGVCLTAGQNKGEVLLGLLARTGYRPDAVVFVDNDPTLPRKHHPRMKAAAAKAALPLFGWRYTRADAAMQAYAAGDKSTAIAQLQEFLRSGRLLSDEAVAQDAARLQGTREQKSALMNELIYGVADPAEAGDAAVPAPAR